MQKQTKGSIFLLLCAMIWGSAFVAQSEGMQYVEPFTMGATRFFLAGLVLLPVIAVLDRKSGHRTGRSRSRNGRSSFWRAQYAALCCLRRRLCSSSVCSPPRSENPDS